MSQLTNKSVYQSKKAYDYALAILAFLIPLVHRGLPLVILVSAVFGMYYFVRAYQRLGKRKRDYAYLPYNILKDSLGNIWKNKNAHLFMVLFFLNYLVSVFYSENKAVAWEGVVLKSSFLYFPILFSLTKWDKEKLIRVFNYFSIGTFLNLILSYVFAFLENEYMFSIQGFTYINLSYTFHPSYVAMYVNCAIIFNAMLLLYKGFEETSYTKILRWCSIILFSLFVIMLSSKAGLITWFMVIGICFLYIAIVKKKFLRALSVAGLFIGIFLLTYNSISIVGNRVKGMADTIEKKVNVTSTQSANSTGSRIGLWESALDVIMENPLFGVGVGDSKDKLLLTYKNKNQTNFYKSKYNSHNQILDTGVAVGGIGVFILVLILVLGLMNYGQTSFFTIGFLGVIGFNLVVESMLERQAGVIFVSWLIALLVSARPMIKSLK